LEENYESPIYSRRIFRADNKFEHKKLGMGILMLKEEFELGDKYNIWPACTSSYIENYSKSKFFTGK
jgi:hypothetical protein